MMMEEVFSSMNRAVRLWSGAKLAQPTAGQNRQQQQRQAALCCQTVDCSKRRARKSSGTIIIDGHLWACSGRPSKSNSRQSRRLSRPATGPFPHGASSSAKWLMGRERHQTARFQATIEPSRNLRLATSKGGSSRAKCHTRKIARARLTAAVASSSGIALARPSVIIRRAELIIMILLPQLQQVTIGLAATAIRLIPLKCADHQQRPRSPVTTARQWWPTTEGIAGRATPLWADIKSRTGSRITLLSGGRKSAATTTWEEIDVHQPARVAATTTTH